MGKNIDTLVKDLYGLFGKEDYIPLENAVADFGHKLSSKVSSRIAEQRGSQSLRLSNMGSPCERQLYYKINHHTEAAPLPPEVRMKFLMGDILEELLLFMAAEAGHTVTGEQDEVSINGVLGHRDAVIDGVLVDVKSASSFSFNKFHSGLSERDDSFGYIGQLSSYLHASRNDPLVLDKDGAAFLVIDKTLGKICLDYHRFPHIDYDRVANQKKEMVSSPVPPARGFKPEADGKSGNMKLGVNCSYCDFRKKCHPGLRTFMYYKGPVFLTKVERVPDVKEITSP